MKDLVVLAADKDLQFTLEGLLARPEALGIRPIERDIFVDPEHDPGCALRGVEFLSPFANEYRHGLDTAAKINCPVHLVTGREDVMAPPRATRDLIAALSVVRVVELPDCGHMLMAEQPDAVRDALIAAFPLR